MRRTNVKEEIVNEIQTTKIINLSETGTVTLRL